MVKQPIVHNPFGDVLEMDYGEQGGEVQSHGTPVRPSLFYPHGLLHGVLHGGWYFL